MSQRIASLAMAAAMTLAAGYAIAKIPPPPPPTDAQKAAADAKKEKDKAAAETAKAELAAAQERAIANYHENMKRQGKPIPKAVTVAAQSEPPKGGSVKPEADTTRAAQKSKADAAAAQDKAKGKK
jgi:hypothetical protein